MRSHSSPISDARYNALRHLRQQYPQAFDIRFTVCHLCGSRYEASFRLPGGQRRLTWCYRCGARGAA